MMSWRGYWTVAVQFRTEPRKIPYKCVYMYKYVFLCRLQCVAVLGRVKGTSLQEGVAVCCIVLQCVAAYCSVLQCLVMRCSVSKCVAECE